MTKLIHKLDSFRPDDINICPLLGNINNNNNNNNNRMPFMPL